MRKRHSIIIWSKLLLLLSFCFQGCQEEVDSKRPNILICIADDAGHMGQKYPWVNTPAFDRVAEAGISFSKAYTPNAKCAPSRASLLTARNSWQLKEAANHWNNFDAEFKTFPEALKDLGFFTGFTGKGWGPGIIGKLHVNPEDAFPFDFKAIQGANFTRKAMAAYAMESEKFMSESDKPFCLQVNHPDAQPLLSRR